MKRRSAGALCTSTRAGSNSDIKEVIRLDYLVSKSALFPREHKCIRTSLREMLSAKIDTNHRCTRLYWLASVWYLMPTVSAISPVISRRQNPRSIPRIHTANIIDVDRFLALADEIGVGVDLGGREPSNESI